ncbi:hypothetical protein PR202_gb10805 [Eleusine coracana subsp. coracana]|uniref:Uncharacterized protein n=1 Tax=Eleusine coracana subsp. coracana TaxID=191504 RepID=A0AAV5EK90_ELECO|nr:hypothetical protein QOZ80_3BG0259630 [Eleusine coracana subsp. coracana]GJN23178.1 hypothetical protein PR202_gb10805 [Eleusine coracana subsp. coracana]
MSRAGSRLRRLWRAPARALGRARDMYVRGVTGCARYVPADAAFGYPIIVPAAALSRTHSAASGSEKDLRQLVRAASQRQVEQQQRQAAAAAMRSRSVAGALSMARIDEDAPCEFGVGAADGGALCARSRSCVGDGGAARRARAHQKVVALG